jgi:hypothetical protein
MEIEASEDGGPIHHRSGILRSTKLPIYEKLIAKPQPHHPLPRRTSDHASDRPPSHPFLNLVKLYMTYLSKLSSEPKSINWMMGG